MTSRLRWRGQEGSAVVEFVLVGVLLIFLFLAVLQVAAYVHLRNVLAASAAEGARYAANADVSTDEAAPKTQQIVQQALSRRVADRLGYVATEEPGDGGLVLVRVQVSGSVPASFAPLGALLPVGVSARALKEGR
ncbi:MAG: hypothetical protein NVSMB13_04680 [Mycobacteriales bacterium]